MVKRIRHVDLLERFKGLEKTVKAGVFDNKTYPDGTSVALVATVQEYGSVVNNIPPRPFMRPAVEDNQARIKALAKSETLKILNGKSTPYNLYQSMGMLLVGAIQEKITTVTTPKLDQSTINARNRRFHNGKDSQKPLIDTGHMLASIDFEVIDET